MKITAMGLGHFGGQQAAIRYCARHGAEVLVTERSSEEAFKKVVDEFRGFSNVSFRFGLHELDDFLSADFILVTPAVPPTNPFLFTAQEKGIPIVTEMELFLQNCSGKIIAVTGTLGKSTTVTMIHHLLNKLEIPCRLGGNIGTSLLPFVDEITSEEWIIVELSSFQLHWLKREKREYEIAALTNLLPHHLNWHQTEKEYFSCKQSLFRDQNENQIAVFSEEISEKISGYGKRVPVSKEIEDNFPDHWNVPLKKNAQLALAVALQVCAKTKINIERETLLSHLKSYPGLAHRMEEVVLPNGRTIVNDSKATCPTATSAAIRSFEAPFWAIVGGAEIDEDFQELVDTLVNSSFLQGVALIGTTGKEILKLLELQEASLKREFFSTLEEGVNWCWGNSDPREHILLSPGCPSYDEFRNYEQRGEEFIRLVKMLAVA